MPAACPSIVDILPCSPSAPAASPPDSRLRSLRARIAAIERSSAGPPAFTSVEARHSAVGQSVWTLGDPAIDVRIGDGGLEAGAVHEVKPALVPPLVSARVSRPASWAAAWASACRFALALTVRRLATAPEARREAPILLCFASRQMAELGAPYAPGLLSLGLDPARIIVVEPAKLTDALWTMEEGLKSHALALVLGLVDAVDLTPARRLALSAACSDTPCLLLTHPRGPATAATATRWRVGPSPGASHLLDPEAPGMPRFDVQLERCRGSPAGVRSAPSILEWCDAAYRFRMASDVADGAARPRDATRGKGSALG